MHPPALAENLPLGLLRAMMQRLRYQQIDDRWIDEIHGRLVLARSQSGGWILPMSRTLWGDTEITALRRFLQYNSSAVVRRLIDGDRLLKAWERLLLIRSRTRCMIPAHVLRLQALTDVTDLTALDIDEVLAVQVAEGLWDVIDREFPNDDEDGVSTVRYHIPKEA